MTSKLFCWIWTKLTSAFREHAMKKDGCLPCPVQPCALPSLQMSMFKMPRWICMCDFVIWVLHNVLACLFFLHECFSMFLSCSPFCSKPVLLLYLRHSSRGVWDGFGERQGRQEPFAKLRFASPLPDFELAAGVDGSRDPLAFRFDFFVKSLCHAWIDIPKRKQRVEWCTRSWTFAPRRKSNSHPFCSKIMCMWKMPSRIHCIEAGLLYKWFQGNTFLSCHLCGKIYQWKCWTNFLGMKPLKHQRSRWHICSPCNKAYPWDNLIDWWKIWRCLHSPPLRHGLPASWVPFPKCLVAMNSPHWNTLMAIAKPCLLLGKWFQHKGINQIQCGWPNVCQWLLQRQVQTCVENVPEETKAIPQKTLPIMDKVPANMEKASDVSWLHCFCAFSSFFLHALRLPSMKARSLISSRTAWIV